ncbi:MAG: TonB family protein, partial [Nitrospina sp.]|nr:TonB family protein [Nitrospina sp.]
MKIFIQTLLVTLLFSIIGFSFALADEKLPDISKMSEEEINKLPKDVIEKLPIKELVNRMGGDKFALVFPFLLSDALAKLGYFPPPSEKQIREAIQKFQRDIGQPETGELTKGQFEELQLRSTRITDTPVYLPTFGDEIKVYGYSDYLTTKGTWIIEGEKIYAPINHSEIRCRKSQGTCEVFQALTDIPKLRGTGLFGQVKDSYTLRMSNDTFEIISWTDSEVISQTGAKCRTTIMTINIKNNEVFQITRNKGDNECDAGIVSLPQLEKPRISKLIPGYKFSYEFWSNRKKEARKYLSTDYLKLAKETIKPLETAKNKKKENTVSHSKHDDNTLTDVKSKYIGLVQEKIYKNWKEPLAEEHNQETVVSFYIFPRGNIDKPFIKKSSGVTTLDTLAVQAVLDSAPFPELPKELNMSNLHVNIYFKYVPKMKTPDN